MLGRSKQLPAHNIGGYILHHNGLCVILTDISLDISLEGLK